MLAFCLLSVFLLAMPSRSFAAPPRQHESALSDAEVEKLRASAMDPQERVLNFIDFLNLRAASIEKLTSGKRAPGREEDLHDLLEQFTSILDDFEDNLDDYSQRHNDVRKTLPKLVAATERWGTILRTPPEDPAYSVSRKLALESLNDVHQSAVAMIPEQKAWFQAHPPSKASAPNANR